MKFFEWILHHIDLCICIVSVLIFFAICAVYFAKIAKLKKSIKLNYSGPLNKDLFSEEEYKKMESRLKNLAPDGKYLASLVCAFILTLLPFLVRMETLVLTAICACGDLAAFIVLKDRLNSLK